MANAVKKTKTIAEMVRVEKVVDDGVTLTLTDAEATALMSLVGRCTGSVYSGPRAETDKIYNALRDSGVKSKRLARNETFWLEY